MYPHAWWAATTGLRRTGAGALYELLALDAAEVPREMFDCVNLLVGRLVKEAQAAAWGGGA